MTSKWNEKEKTRETNNVLARCNIAGWTLAALCFVWAAGNQCLAQGEAAQWEQAAEGSGSVSGARRFCLSLGVLSRRVSRALAEGQAVPDELLKLCGIGYLEGFVVDDSASGDVILVGRQSPSRPALRLDDLIVNMRNVSRPGPAPYCSLDPREQDIRAMEDLFRSARSLSTRSESDMLFRILVSSVGPQQVVVGGVPRNSRHAHIMIDADYHMKKVSQGHERMPGVTSYLDHSLQEVKQVFAGGRSASADEGISMARFWFHIGPDAPVFREARNIVWLERCPVVVLTEKQRARPSGELYDVEEDDPTAIAFADDFSREFTRLTGHVPVYAELENLFRLRALLLAMKHRGSLAKVGWDFSSFLGNYTYRNESPMEPNLPGLANRREWSGEFMSDGLVYEYYVSPMVCGGVGMDMKVDDRTFVAVRSVQLVDLQKEVLVTRPSRDALFWEMSTADKLPALAMSF